MSKGERNAEAKRWDRVLNPIDNLDCLMDLSSLLCSRLVCDFRSNVEQFIASRDFVNLGKLSSLYSSIYSDSSNVYDVITIRQIEALFKKNRSVGDLSNNDRRAAAIKKYFEAEQTCSETNTFIKTGAFDLARSDVCSVLYIAVRKIASVLGDVPSLSELELSFGPGSNTGCKRKTSARFKLNSRLECSTNLIQLLPELLREMPALSDFHSCDHTETYDIVDVSVVPGELAFVPKDGSIDRTICVEPLLNTMFQRGVGKYLKNRLLHRAAIDLRDQTRNSELARLGSLDNSLATIDLSSASDTISKELVWKLLPLDWASFLNHGRTSEISHDGEIHRIQKFSSMGNGFTFELESLIFYSLAYGVCRHLSLPVDTLSVFGDDIIINANGYPLLREVLEWCGFSVNSEKSFHTGPFRESCGKDWFLGINVRPCYVKDSLTYLDLFRIHNFFYGNYDDESCSIVLGYIPISLRLFGPDSDAYGDGHLRSRSFSATPFKRSHGWSGYTFLSLISVSRKDATPLPGDCILPHYAAYAGLSRDAPFDSSVYRGVVGYRKTRIYTLHM